MNPQIGARVLALDPADRVLLILSIDPDEPDRRWWDTPGGKSFEGERQEDTAKRELREEAGIVVDELERHLWDREVWYRLRGQWHYRKDRVYLARVPDVEPVVEPAHTANERENLIEARWWSLGEMRESSEWFLPRNLPDLVADVLDGTLQEPLRLVL